MTDKVIEVCLAIMTILTVGFVLAGIYDICCVVHHGY